MLISTSLPAIWPQTAHNQNLPVIHRAREPASEEVLNAVHYSVTRKWAVVLNLKKSTNFPFVRDRRRQANE
jgi:hypothetical protein